MKKNFLQRVETRRAPSLRRGALSMAAAAMMFFATGLSAQVTIGSGDVPKDFSVLELVSNDTRGLRLPQIETTARRDEIFTDADGFKTNDLAQGLQIFNMETRCVETWNGTKWIGACAPVICAEFPALVSFCSSPAPTIADLNEEVGAVAVWYASDTGGEPLSANTKLVNNTTYYAGNCSDQSTRRGVTVELVSCSSAVAASRIRVITFTNVMYDFQHQTLESYLTGGAGATDYQWQVSKDNVTYSDIPNATARTYTIPADVIHKPSLLGLSDYSGMSSGSDKADGELWFRVRMKNPVNGDTWAATPSDYTLAIAFIKTTNSGQGSGYLSGYGELNGVRYLDLNSTIGDGSVRERVALLNLGQSGTGSFNMNVQQQPEDAVNLNDAGDLGDFYQWGRIADGHEKIVWGKLRDVNPSLSGYGNNRFDPGTSATVAKGTGLVAGVDYQSYDNPANQGGQMINPDYVGKFITEDGYYNSNWGAADNSWGSNDYCCDLTEVPDHISEWSFVNNNVCPEGWRVPSRYEWSEMYCGVLGNVSTGAYSDEIGYEVAKGKYLINAWRYRYHNNNTKS